MHRNCQRGYNKIIIIAMQCGPFQAFNSSTILIYLITYKKPHISFKGKRGYDEIKIIVTQCGCFNAFISRPSHITYNRPHISYVITLPNYHRKYYTFILATIHEFLWYQLETREFDRKAQSPYLSQRVRVNRKAQESIQKVKLEQVRAVE